ncbi:MAG: hypothetical protein AAB874_02870, partial [Patescibacteria group bacterium]
MNKFLIALVVVVLIGGGAWFLMKGTSTKPEPAVESEGIDLNEANEPLGSAPLREDATNTSEAKMAAAEGQKTFNVDASKFKFSVTEMK